MLDIKDFIGQGRHGDVLDGTITGFRGATVTNCVIVSLRPNASQTDKARFKEMANAAGLLSHQHVTKFIAMVVGGNPPGVVVEKHRSDLKVLLREAAPTEAQPAKISIANQVRKLQEITQGLEYLESVNYAHDDLGSRSIMIADDGRLLVGTVSILRAAHGGDYYDDPRKGLLPVRWMAPESLTTGLNDAHSMIWM